MDMLRDLLISAACSVVYLIVAGGFYVAGHQLSLESA